MLGAQTDRPRPREPLAGEDDLAGPDPAAVAVDSPPQAEGGLLALS
ncbi:hypothetical protein ON003_03520 [Janibacter hoylei]|nr:hypothetical protein [Janibacter hoylei]MCW4600777.1 hypothetical protein [Janibacter hoylei]